VPLPVSDTADVRETDGFEWISASMGDWASIYDSYLSK
jgi:hypothetical protein